MPVVSCPKCPTKLRVADGATGNVKCPKCQTIFPAAAAAAPPPAFEVVDDAPAKPAAKSPPPQPAAKAPGPESAFNFDPTPKRKKPRADDEDEDDRPRSKRRRDDDEDDDDRPRSKRRRDDDDDDDYDDRPRGKNRRRRDDDDDDDDYRPKQKKNGFAPAKTGTLLMGIGMWCYTGMFGLLALFFLIGMATDRVPDGLFAVAGICGVANTILLIIGLSFCIAGPSKVKGIAIATVSVTGVHLILVIISYNNMTSGLGRGGFGGFVGGIDWILLGTSLWVLDIILPVLIYMPKGGGGGGGGEFILLVLAGACELARMIMVAMTIKAAATAAKDYDSAEKAGKSVIVTSLVCGIAAGVFLLLVVIIDAAKMGRSSLYLMGLGITAICVGYALMAMTGALAAMQTKDSLARRARRG